MKGLGGLGNIANLMKQAQEMQKKLGSMKDELEREQVSASSGGGMVTVTLNGQQKMTAIKIDPLVVNAEDVAMLEDLILVAVNEAQDSVQAMVKERMSEITGGLSIPGIMP